MRVQTLGGLIVECMTGYSRVFQGRKSSTEAIFTQHWSATWVGYCNAMSCRIMVAIKGQNNCNVVD